MSTFKGFVSEFPNIRIDFYRTLPGKPPPLACFLSHVHSDHLQGLESLKSPFIYCSATTRELLLRLEKYPHRMNFSKGLLECRKQTYKHLKPLLKALPLDTPTKIELSPGNEIQVTLFDANHCAGAVMFLVEGQGKAILYTGDIRSEEWWVNALIRHPVLLPYTMSHKRLDKLYLDTTFATKTDPYRCFPSKASGLQELLKKLQVYPNNTIFYFQAWTFGYEDVWLALSQALNSSVHLDRYRYSLYTSVSRSNGPGLDSREAPILCGFKFGNTLHKGILTEDPTVRLHSCERGASCAFLDKPGSEVVTITPIISRHAGVEMRELGAGGGQGDLDQIHELDLSDPMAIGFLLKLCSQKIADPAILRQITEMLCTSLIAEKGRLQLGHPVDDDDDKKNSLNLDLDQEAIPLDRLPSLIAELAINHRESTTKHIKHSNTTTSTLPKSITFPYSRHSSYSELRNLVAAFRPRDVWPCTVPPDEAWSEESSMESMFGDVCDNERRVFAFDLGMREIIRESRKRKRDAETQVNEEATQEERVETQVEEDETQESQEDRREQTRESREAGENVSEGEFESALTNLDKRDVEEPPRTDATEGHEKTLEVHQAEPPHIAEQTHLPTTQASLVNALSETLPNKTPLKDATEGHEETLGVHLAELSNASKKTDMLTTRASHTNTVSKSTPNQPPLQHDHPPKGHARRSTPDKLSPFKQLQPKHQRPHRTHDPTTPTTHSGTSHHISRPQTPIPTANQTTSAANKPLSATKPQPAIPSTIAPPKTPASIAPAKTPATITTPKIPTTTTPTAPKTSTSTTTLTTPQKSPSQRLQARKEAAEKAILGLWHEVKLESVRGRGKGGGEGEEEEEL